MRFYSVFFLFLLFICSNNSFSQTIENREQLPCIDCISVSFTFKSLTTEKCDEITRTFLSKEGIFSCDTYCGEKKCTLQMDKNFKKNDVKDILGSIGLKTESIDFPE